MTENIFNANEIIEELNNKFYKRIYDFEYMHSKQSEAPVWDNKNLLINARQNLIKEHTKAIIEITVYELEIKRLGKCCKTYAELCTHACQKCVVSIGIWDFEKHWKPRITEATFGLE